MKLLSLLTTVFLVLAGLSVNVGAAGKEKIPVCVSILPQAFFVEQIGGERVVVDVLVQPGQSPATYAPTPKQMAQLARARVFFRIGVAFENVFIPKIQSSMPDLLIVDTRQGIKLEQMDSHDDHNHGELDPHTWLDPMLVKEQTKIIRDSLSRIDPDGKDFYNSNFTVFADKLDALHAKLTMALAPVKGKSFFVFHPAFGYFARAYGLQQIAVETGGKKPSGRHLARLIESAREKQIKILFVQPQFSRKSAETIARAIDGAVVPLDPLARDYFTNMTRIADTVEQALR